MNAHPRDFRREAPHNTELEQALLGAILVNNAALAAASDLSPDDFYEPLHRKVFEVLTKAINSGQSATPISIKNYLPADDKVGELTVGQYVLHLAAEAVTVINAADYASGIAKLSTLRSLISIGEQLIDEAFGCDVGATPHQIIAETEARISDLLSRRPDTTSDKIDDVADGMLDRLSQAVTRPGIPLPLPQLRDILSGDMEPGRLVGMLSASGEGKTSMALQIANHAAENGFPVMILSYDQSKEEILQQIVCQRSGVDSTRVRNRTWMEREAERFLAETAKVRTLPLRIRKCNGSIDTAGHLVGYVKRSLVPMCRKVGKPGLVMVDHSRKVKARNENTHEGRIAAEINGVFKQAAADLDLVWFNLMQRGGVGVKRKNPRPIDSDIFGGEMGKEDYDAVFYLYRGWKYWQNQLATAEDAKDEDKINARFSREKWQEDEAELGVLKWRFGNPSQRFRVRFEAEYTRYVSKRPEQDPKLFEEVS